MQRLLCLFAAFVVLVALAPVPALAQVTGIQDVPPKSALSAGDLARIKTYVEGLMPSLTDKDPVKIKNGRDLLLRPLVEAKTVTFDFRREYATVLVPKLKDLIKSQSDHVAANALRIAGELATQSVVDDVLLEGLKDKRSSVRYGAAFGIARMFENVSLHSPAIIPSKLQEVIRAIALLIKTEPDPLVLDGLVLAMNAALKVPPAHIKDSEFTWTTLSALTDAATARFAGLAKEDKPGRAVPVMLRIAVAIRDTATRANLAVPEAQKAAVLKMVTSGLTATKALRDLPPEAGVNKSDLDRLESGLKAITDLLGSNRAPGG